MKPTFRCLAVAAAIALAAPDAVPQASPSEASKDKTAKEATKDGKAPAKGAKATAKTAKPANAPSKGAAPGKTQVSKNVTIYRNTPPPPLKGKDGKDIPVTADAYDVSSALPKKK